MASISENKKPFAFLVTDIGGLDLGSSRGQYHVVQVDEDGEPVATTAKLTMHEAIEESGVIKDNGGRSIVFQVIAVIDF